MLKEYKIGDKVLLRKGKVDFLAKWVRQDFEAGKYCIGIAEKDLIWNVALNCG